MENTTKKIVLVYEKTPKKELAWKKASESTEQQSTKQYSRGTKNDLQLIKD